MVKFAAIPEAAEGDLFFCMSCEQWTATRAVLNSDNTWRGVACCDDERHGLLAVHRHNGMLELATPFYGPDEVA